MSSRIRAMQQSDVDRVYAIETIAHHTPWGHDILRDCVLVGYDCRVLEIEKSGQWQLASYVISRYSDAVCHVLNLCVAPDLQGQGYGRALLQAVIDAPTRTISSLVLEVRPSNTVALHLYEKIGFLRIGKKLGYYQDADGEEDAIVLQYIK